MNQRVAEPEESVAGEQGNVEDYLKTLWERVHTAGDMIRDLRGEKEKLGSRVAELERDLSAMRSTAGLRLTSV